MNTCNVNVVYKYTTNKYTFICQPYTMYTAFVSLFAIFREVNILGIHGFAVTMQIIC